MSVDPVATARIRPSCDSIEVARSDAHVPSIMRSRSRVASQRAES